MFVGTCALRKGARKKADPRDASRPGRDWIGYEVRVISEGDYWASSSVIISRNLPRYLRWAAKNHCAYSS